MPRKKDTKRVARKIEPYEGTAEVMLKMIMESDKWLINNFKTGIYAWTIFTIANSIFTFYIWWIFGFQNIISYILIFTLGIVWGMYVISIYQTKQKINAVKNQMKALKKREEDFLKKFQ